jgi:hypothetical protein
LLDIWNATIEGHSTEAMVVNLIESVTIHVDPGFIIDKDDWRSFKVEVFVNCRLVGGIIFNASMPPPTLVIDPVIIAAMIAAGLLLVALFYHRRRESS